MRTSKSSQVILAYAILIVVVIAVFLSMSGYIKRRLQGSYKKAADVFGLEEQFDPN